MIKQEKAMFGYDRFDIHEERQRRCCDDERELMLAAAEREFANERLARRRDQTRRVRRMVARAFGWPYPARQRRVARHLAAAAWR